MPNFDIRRDLTGPVMVVGQVMKAVDAAFGNGELTSEHREGICLAADFLETQVVCLRKYEAALSDDPLDQRKPAA